MRNACRVPILVIHMQEESLLDKNHSVGYQYRVDTDITKTMENVMSDQQKDPFWLYVALATAALVAVIVMVKVNENDKYAPIINQQNEEIRRMNIRVLN